MSKPLQQDVPLDKSSIPQIQPNPTKRVSLKTEAHEHFNIKTEPNTLPELKDGSNASSSNNVSERPSAHGPCPPIDIPEEDGATLGVIKSPDSNLHESNDHLKIAILPEKPERRLEKNFSWYHEDQTDSQSLRKVGPCRKCFKKFKGLPLFVKSVIYSLLGSIVFMLPGLISYFFYISENDRANHNFLFFYPVDNIMSMGGYPFFNFAVFFSIIWCAWFGLNYAFSVFPEIIVRSIDVMIGTTGFFEDLSAETVEHYVDYLRHLRNYLTILVWSAVTLVTWSAFFIINQDGRYNKGDPYCWQNVIQSLLLCLVFGSLVWLIEKFFLQVFAVQFHKTAYSDRLLKNKYEMSVLGQLNKARKKKKALGIDNTLTESDLSPSSTEAPKKETSYKNLRSKAAGFSMGILSVVGAAVGVNLGFSVGVILRTPADAKKLAKKLFQSLCRGSSGILTINDFLPYFKSKEEAEKAFKMFDKDGNGDINRHEMKMTVLETFHDHQSLENSIRQSSQAIAKLDAVLRSVVLIIILFICLGVWNVDTQKYLAAAISIWASLLFAFGGLGRALIESVIFLFVVHPYDVGDRVDIDLESYTVLRFGLNSTVFKRSDGKECYVPNSVLSSKIIHNVRRSGPQSEKIEITVSLDTPASKVMALQEKLVNYLEKEESRELFPKLDIQMKELYDSKRMILTMSLEHRSNWQEGARKSQRKNRFMWKLKDCISEVGIQLIEKN